MTPRYPNCARDWIICGRPSVGPCAAWKAMKTVPVRMPSTPARIVHHIDSPSDGPTNPIGIEKYWKLPRNHSGAWCQICRGVRSQGPNRCCEPRWPCVVSPVPGWHRSTRSFPLCQRYGLRALPFGHDVGDRALGHLGAEADRLGEGRVRVDGEADVLGVEARLDRQDGLGEQLAGVDADDARAEDAVGARLDDQLGQAVGAADAQRAARGGPGEARRPRTRCRRPWPGSR